MYRLSSALLSAFILVGCGDNGNAADPAEVRESGRGNRYCEILLGYREGALIQAEVWGTQVFSTCPEEEWGALDPDSIQAEYEAIFIRMNGPRYSLGDSGRFDIPEDAPSRFYGGIEMKQFAVLELDPTADAGPYGESTVRRDSYFEYWAGSEIYELTAPDGEVYRMISMALYVDTTLSLADLPTLDERLALPDGWTYRSRVLEADSVLSADGEAVVLTDELSNTYQRL